MNEMTPGNHQGPIRQRGFTLLEAMIALMIFSISLLGLAGLQASSIEFNKSAYLRTQATFLAYDMLDRMRANKNKANDTSGSGGYAISTGSVPSYTDCTGSSKDCSESEMFIADRGEWKDELDAALPDGDGEVTYDTSNSRPEIVITVYWDDDRDGSADSLSIRAEL